MGEPWREVADGVLVRRHASLDLNAVLVVGAGACLVVDTRASVAEGQDLADAVRRVTRSPWTVVCTHAHHDHCLGTAAFLPAPVWAQRGCATALARDGEAERERVAGLHEDDGDPVTAAQVRASPLVVPERLVEDRAVLDVGGRRVELRHLGRGHTDHDLVVLLPDDGVVLAGDLVEEGAPPQFDDAFPLDWPAALDRLARLDAPVVVPGHGDVVDLPFVAAQQALLAELVRRCREGRAAGADPREVAAALPDLGAFALQAVQRTLQQLGG